MCGSHCESPSLFYCHLVQTASDLQKLMTALTEVYSFLDANELTLSTPTVGMCCAAQFTGMSLIYHFPYFVHRRTARQTDTNRRTNRQVETGRHTHRRAARAVQTDRAWQTDRHRQAGRQAKIEKILYLFEFGNSSVLMNCFTRSRIIVLLVKTLKISNY